MIHLYGIPNCDTVRKARKWLDARGLDYAFHDFKTEGADRAKVASWIEATGLDTVINRRGTTWRKLGDDDKAKAESGNADSHGAVALLVQHPSMIKRPVVEHPGGILVGFREDEWSEHLS